MNGRTRIMRKTIIRKMAHPQHTIVSGAKTTIWEREYMDTQTGPIPEGQEQLHELPNPLWARRIVMAGAGAEDWWAINGASVTPFPQWSTSGGTAPPYSADRWLAQANNPWEHENVRANLCQEWVHWGSKYYYFRILKVIHKWTYSQYSLETTAGAENAYFTIAIMPHQGDRNWEWNMQKEDLFGWRSLGHAGAIIKRIEPGKTITYTCKPSWSHTRDDGTVVNRTDSQWQRTDDAAMVARSLRTMHWRAWSSLMTSTTSPVTLKYHGTCKWPSPLDRIVYRRWCVIQFASAKDEREAYRGDT